jgi:hypothetical protein
MPSNLATRIGRQKASAKRNAPRLSCRGSTASSALSNAPPRGTLRRPISQQRVELGLPARAYEGRATCH